MKFELNFEKKHLYIISGLVAVAMIALIAYAVVNPDPGHKYDQLDLGPITINSGSSATVNGDLTVTGTFNKVITATCTDWTGYSNGGSECPAGQVVMAVQAQSGPGISVEQRVKCCTLTLT